MSSLPFKIVNFGLRPRIIFPCLVCELSDVVIQGNRNPIITAFGCLDNPTDVENNLYTKALRIAEVVSRLRVLRRVWLCNQTTKFLVVFWMCFYSFENFRTRFMFVV